MTIFKPRPWLNVIQEIIMAGLYAVVTSRTDGRALTASRRLAEDMCLLPWQKADVPSPHSANVMLGSITNRKPNDHPEAFVYRDENVSCVLEGYLVRSMTDGGINALIDAGRFAEAAALAYLIHGASFAEFLEGPFTVAIHDNPGRRLVVANGRFASSHLYLSRCDEGFVACTMLGPMGACGMFRPNFNEEALGHVLIYGIVLGRDTLLDGVEAIEPGTIGVVELDAMNLSLRRYWSFGDMGGHKRGQSLKQHAAEVGDTLVAAAKRVTRRPGRYVSGLSGGLDSRLVTALATRCDPDMKIWTYGTPDSADMTTASRISAHLGRDHLRFLSDPERTPRHAAMYSTTVDGCVTAEFAFRLERTNELMDSADIVLNGFAGDAILGGSMLGPRLRILVDNIKQRNLRGRDVVSPFLSANTHPTTIAGYVASKYDYPSQLHRVLTHKPETMSARVLRDVRAMDGDVPMELRAEQWIFDNRVTRWTLMGVLSDRHYYSDGSL